VLADIYSAKVSLPRLFDGDLQANLLRSPGFNVAPFDEPQPILLQPVTNFSWRISRKVQLRHPLSLRRLRRPQSLPALCRIAGTIPALACCARTENGPSGLKATATVLGPFSRNWELHSVKSSLFRPGRRAGDLHRRVDRSADQGRGRKFGELRLVPDIVRGAPATASSKYAVPYSERSHTSKRCEPCRRFDAGDRARHK